MLGCLVGAVDALEPTVVWKLETAAMPHGPTLFPNAKAPRGLVLGIENEILLVDGAGAVQWRFVCDAPVATSVTVADLDGDGAPECIALLTGGTLLCLDAAGNRRWGVPPRTTALIPARSTGEREQSRPRAGVYNLVVASDVHPARGVELLFGLDDGWLRCVSADGELLWRFFGDRFRVGSPAVGDADGDGAAEIIYGTDNGNVYCLSGLGEVKWRYTEREGPFGRSGVNLADLDGDGRAEVLLTRSNTGLDRGLVALDGSTGAFKWHSPTAMQGYVSNAVVDLDGDGRLEVLHADKGNWVYCTNADGSERWRAELAGRGIFWAPAVGDVTGDGSPDIVVCVRDTDPEVRANVFLLDASGGVRSRAALGANANASPVLADLDGDGALETIVCTSRPNGVQALRWGGAGSVQWASMRGDSAMQACTNGPPGGPTKRLLPINSTAIEVEIDQVLFGTNTLDASWSSPARENAYAVVSVRSKGVTDDITVVRIAKGATAATLPWRMAARTAEITVALHASGTTAPLGSWRGRVRARAIHTSALAEVRAACERAGLLRRLAPLEAEAALLHHIRDARPDATLIARAETLRCEVVELGRIAGALEALRARGDTGRFVVWEDPNPWDAFDPRAMPEAVDPTLALHIAAFGNEQESVALNLLNVSDRALDVRCVFEKPRFDNARPQGEPPLARYVTLRRVVRVPSDKSGMVPDALPELDLSRTITLPPFETQQLWIVVDTRGLEPGVHALTLYLGSLEARSTVREVPLTIEIAPVALTEGVYAQMNWVGIDIEQTSDQQLRDMLEHGITVGYGPVLPVVPVDETGRLAGAIDWARVDAGLDRVPDYFQVLWHAPPPVRWPKGVSVGEDDPRCDAGFATALRALIAHLEARGFGYERWGLYPYDEPWLTGNTLVPLLKRYCERVKAVDPKVRMYADPAGYVRAEFLDEFKDLIDIWQPEMNLLKRDPTLVRWFHENARTLWAYEATDPGKDLLPLGYYRAFAWLAWLYQLDGAGFWVYKYADPFWPLESTN